MDFQTALPAGSHHADIALTHDRWLGRSVEGPSAWDSLERQLYDAFDLGSMFYSTGTLSHDDSAIFGKCGGFAISVFGIGLENVVYPRSGTL